MRLDKFTVKAQEAVQAAQSLTDQMSHQAIEPEHLLLALIQQREGVVGPLLGRLGARPDAIQSALQAELARMPKVRGGSGQYLGERLRAALERAQREAERLRDEYVSAEHLRKPGYWPQIHCAGEPDEPYLRREHRRRNCHQGQECRHNPRKSQPAPLCRLLH